VAINFVLKSLLNTSINKKPVFFSPMVIIEKSLLHRLAVHITLNHKPVSTRGESSIIQRQKAPRFSEELFAS